MKKYLLVPIILLSLSNVSLFGQDMNGKKSVAADRIIKVDYNKSAGKLNTMFKECIGAGRANEG